MDLDPLDHQLHTCSNRDLSDGKRLRCDRAFHDLPCNMWLHKGAPIKIGRAKEKREIVGPRHGIMAHFKHTIVAIQSLFIRLNDPRFLREISL